MDKKTVIVTDAHYRAAVSVVRELAEAGYHVIVPVLEGESLPVAAYSKGCGEVCKVNGMADVYKLAVSKNAVIFPCGAASLKTMAKEWERFSNLSLTSDEQTLNKANDKTYVANLAASIGIPVPKTLDLTDKSSFNYPVIVKYVDGEGLGKKAQDRYKIARSEEDLDLAIERMGNHPIFISEYIEGDGYGVSVLMDRDSRSVAVFCHERLREYPLSGGPSVKCRSVWDEKMAADGVKILKELKFTGLGMVEFKGSPDNYALLEINPRIWGSYPLGYLAKAGFAEKFARAAAGETLAETLELKYKTGVKMQYFISGARWALAAGKDRKSPVPILKYAADIINPKIRHGLWSIKDPKPGFAYIKNLADRKE